MNQELTDAVAAITADTEKAARTKWVERLYYLSTSMCPELSQAEFRELHQVFTACVAEAERAVKET